ncbi:methyltransferase domain-containing protein [Thermodesulfobacteriota bacterium]
MREFQKQSAYRSLFLSAASAKPNNACRAQLAQDPLNPKLHCQFAEQCSRLGKNSLAWAELKTALALGINPKAIEQLANDISSRLPKKEEMDHNQYFRFYTLSSAIRSMTHRNPVSLLDIGGGQGQLAQFIPEASYILAEPTENGISGMNLPFVDGSIDYVVACHVLEHIPSNSRDVFLDHLLSKAKMGLVLLNPFYNEKTYVDERLRLFIEITGADWAKEHLECSLPKIEMIQKYATIRGLECNIKPNGILAASMLMVFVSYFAHKAGLKDDLKKVNRFLNQRYSDILCQEKFPNAHLVILTHRQHQNSETNTGIYSGG